jgi:hypothetical protein
MAVRLSALRTSRTLLSRNIIILMLLVLISVRGWVSPGPSATGRIRYRFQIQTDRLKHCTSYKEVMMMANRICIKWNLPYLWLVVKPHDEQKNPRTREPENPQVHSSHQKAVANRGVIFRLNLISSNAKRHQPQTNWTHSLLREIWSN